MNQKTIKKYSSLAFKKYRDIYGLFLAEGYHVVEELLNSDWEIESLITSNNEMSRRLGSLKSTLKPELVKSGVIDKIAEAKTPQEILAIVKIPQIQTDISIHNRIVIADGIKDPGNMGTLIRTAHAFGFDAVITTSKSVDIFNPKVVRATQGAMFGLRLFYDVKTGIIFNILGSTHTFYALDPRGDTDIDDIESDDRYVLMVGSEIEGVSESLLNQADYRIRISHDDSVDSLNAAVAAGIAMYRFCGKQ
jgi:TrmH family RNA methyltransferase